VSRRIDLTKPLTADDVRYLTMMGRERDIERNKLLVAEIEENAPLAPVAPPGQPAPAVTSVRVK